jgi:hypothetical protein
VTGGIPGAALEGLRALGLGREPDLRVLWHDNLAGPDGGGEGDGHRVHGVPGAPAPIVLNDWLREEAGRDRVELIAVELVHPSNDEEIDRAAVQGVRAAAEKLPVPPDEARGGRQRLVTLWEFALDVSITPPLPVVGIEWDEVKGVTDVRLPLDRRIWKRVRLVALM